VEVLTTVDAERIRSLRARDEFFWLDLAGPSDEDLELVGRLLGLHPLAVEDTREWNQRPKVDPYGDNLLLVFCTARIVDRDELVEPLEVHLHISGGFVFTARRGACTELDDLHGVLVPEDFHEEEYVVYRILDGLVDSFDPVLDALEARIDELEAAILTRTRRYQLTTIYRLKQAVHALARMAVPQREALEEAVHALLTLPGLTRSSKPYLRDVVDGVARVGSELQRHNADLAGLADTFFNANQNRLNLQATRLTVVATFFLVWTLVTSFFGQNFGWLVDRVDSRSDFLLFGVGGLLLPTLALAALFWWRRDEWW